MSSPSSYSEHSLVSASASGTESKAATAAATAAKELRAAAPARSLTLYHASMWVSEEELTNYAWNARHLNANTDKSIQSRAGAGADRKVYAQSRAEALGLESEYTDAQVQGGNEGSDDAQKKLALESGATPAAREPLRSSVLNHNSFHNYFYARDYENFSADNAKLNTNSTLEAGVVHAPVGNKQGGTPPPPRGAHAVNAAASILSVGYLLDKSTGLIHLRHKL